MIPIDKKIFTLIAFLCIALAYFMASLGNDIISSISLQLGWKLGNVGIPFGVFFLLYQGLTYVYEKWLWPKFHRDRYVAGTWIYALRNDHTKAKVYGHFSMKQGPHGTAIVNEHCWYYPGGPQNSNLRGVWSSNSVTFIESPNPRLLVHFTMSSTSERAEAGRVAKYEGFLDLQPSLRITPALLEGQFHDLYPRAESKGVLYAKRERPKKSDKVEHLAWAYSRNVFDPEQGGL